MESGPTPWVVPDICSEVRRTGAAWVVPDTDSELRQLGHRKRSRLDGARHLFGALSEPLSSATSCGTITPMALAQKKATTIALEPATDRLLTRAARSNGVSRSEFVRRQLDIVLEQYRPHPRPRSAGIIKHPLPERGDEAELFRERG
jgi:hypothetical protein